MFLYSIIVQVHFMGESQAPYKVVFCCKNDVPRNLSSPSTQGTNHGFLDHSISCSNMNVVPSLPPSFLPLFFYHTASNVKLSAGL